MNIRIKTTDYKMEPGVSDYLDERIEVLTRLLGDHADVTRCEVEIGRDAGKARKGKNLYFAEFIVIQPGLPRVVARNNSETVNGAIDDAKEEAMQQLRKMKKTREVKTRKAGANEKRAIRSR